MVTQTGVSRMATRTEGRRRLRRRGLGNLLRMGHCAPAIVQTILDTEKTDARWLVRAAAGLPGGIGNTGCECGGLTAPLLLLGLHHAADPLQNGLPVTTLKGHQLVRTFTACHGTTQCCRIRGDQRVPLRCIGVVRRAAEQYAVVASDDSGIGLDAERVNAYARLQAHLSEQKFHCALAVLDELPEVITVKPAVRDATAAFSGGTIFLGMTCSALTAGVVALGLAVGRIENSRARVLRMIGLMAAGGNAFADDVNEFNRVMNLGHRLAESFTASFGSTQCRAITQCDFSTAAGVQQYIECNGIVRCRGIARGVAAEVRRMIESASRSSKP